jgi:hypothetical protein
MFLTFIQTPGFVASAERVGFSDEDLQELEQTIMDRPNAGAVMPGTGGVRKIRFAPSAWHTGKSGATRVCYVVIVDAFCYMIAAYAKADQGNLSQSERNVIRKYVEILKQGHRES